MSFAELRRLYDLARATPSDIVEHVPTLHRLAKQCRHVTEFGTRSAVSTTALAYALPEKLHCYDLDYSDEARQVLTLAAEAGVAVAFHRSSVLESEIEPTDMLFIDTWHVFEQMEQELALHAEKVRRYLVFHDTETFGRYGEPLAGEAFGARVGIWPAIEEFLFESPSWSLTVKNPRCNGLTILTRREA